MVEFNERGPMCKGALALGTGCGKCSRCDLERANASGRFEHLHPEAPIQMSADAAGGLQIITSAERIAQADQWDEKLRGKKMSNSSGKVIFKYLMPVRERFTMKLPKGAEILRVADQDGFFYLWAVVDTRVPDEDRHFVAVKCGANVPEDRSLHYIGMCAIFVQQELALYIFEDITA